jgi:hypothetical protein
VAPPTLQWTTLEKHGRANAWAIVDGVLHYVKYEPFGIQAKLSFFNHGTDQI